MTTCTVQMTSWTLECFTLLGLYKAKQTSQFEVNRRTIFVLTKSMCSNAATVQLTTFEVYLCTFII